MKELIKYQMLIFALEKRLSNESRPLHKWAIVNLLNKYKQILRSE